MATDIPMFLRQRWEHSVDTRSPRRNPTSYPCNWKALSQNSHRMSESPEERCWVLGIERSSLKNPWLITSVASFTNETWSVRDDNEFIHYSSPLGLGTDQYIPPAHQKPQELDAEATGFWTSKQSPIEKLG